MRMRMAEMEKLEFELELMLEFVPDLEAEVFRVQSRAHDDT
jgi:hypothetical protein